ncbi:MAG TPA: glycosyltransferase [Longimicrobiales bacterium]
MSGGGAEAVIEALAAARPDRTRVIILNQVAAPDAPAEPIVTHLLNRGISATEIRCGRRAYLAEARALRSILRSGDIRVVHSHGYHGDLVAFLATRRTRIPLVSTVHGYIRRNLKEHLYNVMDRVLLTRFDAVMAVSPAIVNELSGWRIRKSKLHLVRNGLRTPSRQLSRADARQKLALPQDGAVIGWIGRLSPEKGPDLFLQALATAQVDARAVLIGDGPELPRLQSMINALPEELRARISLAGYQRDAGGLIGAFDLLVLSSRSEGTPMVILEAVASRVPVVAFAVGGIPDLLSDDSAWLARAGDPQALAVALEQALAQPQASAQKAALAASTLADVLSPERWSERVEGVYARAAGRA